MLGAPELFFILAMLLLTVIPAVICIWGIVDATQRPDPVWAAAGQNKTLWIVLMAVGVVSCIGIVASIMYLASIRPKLIAATGAAGGAGGAAAV